MITTTMTTVMMTRNDYDENDVTDDSMYARYCNFILSFHSCVVKVHLLLLTILS